MPRSLHQTYELYLEDQTGAISFEALTCAPGADIVAMARRMLLERDLKSLKVCQLGQLAFIIGPDGAEAAEL